MYRMVVKALAGRNVVGAAITLRELADFGC